VVLLTNLIMLRCCWSQTMSAISTAGRVLWCSFIQLGYYYILFGIPSVSVIACTVRAAVAGVSGTVDPSWLLDSGSVWHITSIKSLIDHTKQVSAGFMDVIDASGKSRSVTQRGVLGELLEVYLVPGFDASTHLLSISELAKLGYISIFLEKEALILHLTDLEADAQMADVVSGKSGHVWLRVPNVNGLCQIPHSVLVKALRDRHREMQVHATRCGCGGWNNHDPRHAAYTVGSSGRRKGESRYWYWHNRLHVSDTVLHAMAKKKMVDLPLHEFTQGRPACTVCMQARVTRQPHRRRKEWHYVPGQLISCDMLYVNYPSVDGDAEYGLMVTDAATGKWWL